MDLSQNIGLLPYTNLTINRRESGSFVNGVYSGGAETEHTIKAIVYPAQPNILQLLPENIRSINVLELITKQEIRPANSETGTQGDRFDFQGFSYEIRELSAWSIQANFYHGIAFKTE